jgi:hypothetical protein
MAKEEDILKAVKAAFAQTVELKLQQFHAVVPKGSNSALTGAFVEEVVRGFVQQWIAPCVLAHGTLHPHDAAERLSESYRTPKQIDGIVYDPRLGPAILREGGFLVTHPAFCRGIIEIKTSIKNGPSGVLEFEEDLQLRYRQYLAPAWEDCRAYLSENEVIGIVIHDSVPEQRRGPDWMEDTPLYERRLNGHCPIFILFKEQNGDYTPHDPAIDGLIRAIFQTGWSSGTALRRIH